MKSFVTLCVGIIACMLVVQNSYAQLRADFTIDKTGGCSPLVVQFTNTTAGASDNAKWRWDFSNGNSSSLKEPSAVFSTEGTYNITLTITDGSQSSFKTKTITVYKRPVIDFSITPVNGCTPLQTTFTGTISDGDGAVSSWNWDFGDGITQQTGTPVVDHLYTFKQRASVSVTATSIYGCSSTLLKENIVIVKDSVRASFTANQTTFCEPDATVTFTNTSTGAGTLTYHWNFGDGTTSDQASPSHKYRARGKYTVTLTASSSEGCAVSMIQTDYINVGSFVTDFQVPSVTCENRSIDFVNISSPDPESSSWYINGSPVMADSDTALQYYFPSTGIYTVKLVNNFALCQQEVSKLVEIKRNPIIDSFVVEHPVFCNSMVDVTFKDTSREAVGWSWDFFGYVNRTTRETTFQYWGDGNYQVRLEIENADGCTSAISQWVNLEQVRVHIVQTDNSGYEDCNSITKSFMAQSNDSVTSYLWNFGDGTTSTQATPEHTYTKPGQYEPMLTYVTAGGCTNKVQAYPGVRVLEPPKGDFTIDSVVCGDTYVNPQPILSGHWWWVRWDYGDGTGLLWGNSAHQYKKEGTYTVTMVLDNGHCNDTITKENIITVKGPFPDIHRVDYTCNGNRDVVTFIDSTRNADLVTWSFGDGATDTFTDHHPVVTHTYPESWNYTVKLTAQKGECILERTREVHVLKKQKPVLSLDRESICINEPQPFTVRGLEDNLYIISDLSQRYSFKKWEYSDGATFKGDWENDFYTWYIDLNGTITVNEMKNDSIRMIMKSYFHNCEDTTNYVPLKMKGVDTKFDVLSDNICFKSPVILNDKSAATDGNKITKWTWDFGDGKQLTTSKGGKVQHYYENPGEFLVTLTASDAGGCTNSVTNSGTPVRVRGAKASFNVSPGTTIAPFNPLQFHNNSNTYFAGSVSFQWWFGDGSRSTERDPIHMYTKAGTYTVRLIALDHGSDCSDTMSMVITCVPEQTTFTKTTLFIGDQMACPPLQASLAFNSNLPYDSLVWKFGDGFSLINQTHPSHIYTRQGTYVVTLDVYNQDILTGTHIDTIFVSGPLAAFAADDLSGCIGDGFTLYTSMQDHGNNYTWDFGNGIVISGRDTAAAIIYNAPGKYSPLMMIRNSAGCASSVKLPESIVIHPNPVITVSPATAIACKEDGVRLEARGGASYTWLPATGLSDATVANPVATPLANTNYNVHATDINGCKGSGIVTVIVPQPISISAVSATEICAGENVQLNASGGVSYQWINHIAGLSNATIRNPVAAPATTTTYTLVGYDQYSCYSDTADITVSVRPLPSISLGDDIRVTAGTPMTLQSTGSTDIVRYNWTPSDYLNCTNCPAPVSTAPGSIEYIVKAYNQYNCEASDTLKITTLCQESVGIPNAFSPNGDGRNDVFGIPVSGVSKVIYLKILNRWGEIVFEKKNYIPDNTSGTWDGRYKGLDSPAGVYVYVTEVECSAGLRFRQKGTIVLVR